jgi:hypothetical protein
MQRIQGDYATEDNRFTDGNPAGGVPATVVTDEWLNGVQEEIMAVIEAAGLTADGADLTQLRQAIAAMIAAGIPEPVGSTTGWTPRGLTVLTTGTDANVAIAAKSLVVADADGHVRELSGVDVTAATTASGAGGLDSGAVATDTWYAVHVIADGAGNAAGLLSLSTDTPTMPSGYTYSRRVGWIRTDGTNGYPLPIAQFGQTVYYTPGAANNLIAYPALAAGVAGSIVTPTWVPVSVSATVPPTAVTICVLGHVQLEGGLLVAPSGDFGGYSSSTNPPPMSLDGGPNASMSMSTTMVLRSTDIYYAAKAAGDSLAVRGWEDVI